MKNYILRKMNSFLFLLLPNLIVLSLLSNHANANTNTNFVTVAQIHEKLTSIHGAHWKTIIRIPQDQTFIKNQLALLITAPQEYFRIHDSQNQFTDTQKTAFYNHALGEYGNFVTYSSGTNNLSPQDAEVLNIERFVSESNQTEVGQDDEYHQWLYSLRNSGSITGFDLMQKNYQQQGSDHRPLRFKLLRFMTDTLVGSSEVVDSYSKTDIDLEKNERYLPHLNVPWTKRSQRAEWEKRNNQLQQLLTQFQAEMRLQHSPLSQESEMLLKKLASVQNHHAKSTSAPTSGSTIGPKQARSITQESKGKRQLNVREIAGKKSMGHELADENMDAGPLKTIALFMVSIMFFFGWLFWFMKRK